MNCADLMVSGSFHLCLRFNLGSRLHVCVLVGVVIGRSRPGHPAALVDLRRREPQPGLGDVSGRSRPGPPTSQPLRVREASLLGYFFGRPAA